MRLNFYVNRLLTDDRRGEGAVRDKASLTNGNVRPLHRHRGRRERGHSCDIDISDLFAASEQPHYAV